MPSLDPTPFKVLILGASYAGLAAALNLVDLCHGRKCRFSVDPDDTGTHKPIPVQVTLVDERDGYYHLIGTPLAVASKKHAATFWTKYTDIPALQTPDIRILQGSVATLDPASKTATIVSPTKGVLHESYDYFVVCTGLRRGWPSAPRALTREQYLADTEENLHSLSVPGRRVVVIGGGAVGIELASEIKTLHPHVNVTLIHSRPALLSSEPLPDAFAARALDLLSSTGVQTILGARVLSTTDSGSGLSSSSGDRGEYTLTLSTGQRITADHVLDAVSRATSTAPGFLPAGVYDEEGYVRITPQLEFNPSNGNHNSHDDGDGDENMFNATDHYAAGDVARWSGVKRGGAAMHQGHYAARNIHQKMMARVYGSQEKFFSLEEVEPGMGLAVGESAVAYFAGSGLTFGEDVRELFFQDDLGFMICWRWMQLGKKTE